MNMVQALYKQYLHLVLVCLADRNKDLQATSQCEQLLSVLKQRGVNHSNLDNANNSPDYISVHILVAKVIIMTRTHSFPHAAEV